MAHDLGLTSVMAFSMAPSHHLNKCPSEPYVICIYIYFVITLSSYLYSQNVSTNNIKPQRTIKHYKICLELWHFTCQYHYGVYSLQVKLLKPYAYTSLANTDLFGIYITGNILYCPYLLWYQHANLAPCLSQPNRYFCCSFRGLGYATRVYY